jgi:hypothetical protein
MMFYGDFLCIFGDLLGHDSTTLHKKPRPHVIRGEPVIKKRKLSNVTISSEPTTSESFDNESISNSQYIYTAEAIHNESVLTEHSYALGTDVLDIVLIQLCVLSWSFFSVGNGKSMKGGLQTQMLVPKLQLCNLRKSAFQFLKWYVLFEHPTTAQIHVEFFNNLK